MNELVADLPVTRHSRDLLIRWIPINRMPRAFTLKLATVLFQVPKDIAALHSQDNDDFFFAKRACFGNLVFGELSVGLEHQGDSFF
jgi:hypothetical protein